MVGLDQFMGLSKWVGSALKARLRPWKGNTLSFRSKDWPEWKLRHWKVDVVVGTADLGMGWVAWATDCF